MNTYAVVIGHSGKLTDAGDYRRSVNEGTFDVVSFHGMIGDEYTGDAASVAKLSEGYSVVFMEGVGTADRRAVGSEKVSTLTHALRLAHGWCIA